MTFKVYKGKDGWRWRLFAKNGRIIADSGEAYTRKGKCVRAVESIILHVSSAKLIIE